MLLGVVDHGPEFIHAEQSSIQATTLLSEQDWTWRCQFDQNCRYEHDGWKQDDEQYARQHNIQDTADEQQRFICRCCAERERGKCIQLVQFHACDRMGKEIQNDPRGDSKLFAQEQRFRKFGEAFTTNNQDQFVHSSGLENGSNLGLVEDSDQLQSPSALLLNRACEFVCRTAFAHNGHVTHIQRGMLRHLQQNDSIRDKKNVVNDQCKQNDEAVRRIVDKKLQSRHDQPRKTDSLRK